DANMTKTEAAATSTPAPEAKASPAPAPEPAPTPAPMPTPATPTAAAAAVTARAEGGERIKASPLAKRLAAEMGIDLSTVTGSGPGGRIVKADLEGAGAAAPAPASTPAATSAAAAGPAQPFQTDIPHTAEKLSNMRKTIARRLTEAKQTIPHIYLTVDIELDKLLKLRSELNAALEPQGVKLSVNDLLIKALAKALIQVPKCNVSYAGDQLISYS